MPQEQRWTVPENHDLTFLARNLGQYEPGPQLSMLAFHHSSDVSSGLEHGQNVLLVSPLPRIARLTRSDEVQGKREA